MDKDFLPSISLRASRRAERNYLLPETKGKANEFCFCLSFGAFFKFFFKVFFYWMVLADGGGVFSAGGKLTPDCSMKIIWKRGFIRLVLVGGIIWMFLILIALFFHIWSCQSSVAFFTGTSLFC